MEEDGPGDDRKQVVKVGEEEVVEGVAVAGNVTHVVEEDEGLPEAVRLVHQLADLIVLVVERREGVVLAAQRTGIGLGQRLDVLAHLLEAVAEDQADQVEVRHGEHVDARHEEDPDALDADPGDKEAEGVLVHVLVGGQRVERAHHAGGHQDDQVVDDDGDLSATLVVVRVVLGRADGVRLHLLHRDEGHEPGELWERNWSLSFGVK